MLSRMACRLCGSTPTVGVQDERARSVQQAGADVEAPFHAPAVGLDPIVAAVRQVDQFQDLVHPPTQRRTAEPIEPAEEGQVLPCGQVGIEGHVLGHVSNLGLGRCGRRTDRRPADGDFAGVCGQQAANQTDGRGLAGAVRAEQTVGLPGCHVEGDVVHRETRAEASAEMGGVQHRRGLNTMARRCQACCVCHGHPFR